MRNKKLVLIASLIAMLALFLGLTAVFPVVASAEEIQEASWGADKDNLTGEGNLQLALNTASTDSTVTYIRLNKDIDLGDDNISAEGGKYTLDLNGHSIISTAYTFNVWSLTYITITDTSAEQDGLIESLSEGTSPIITDKSNVKIRLEGGTIKGTGYAFYLNDTTDGASEAELTVAGGRVVATLGNAIFARGILVKVTGGTLESNTEDITILNGILDFSEHPDPSGITISNNTGEDIDPISDRIILPDGYSIFRDGKKVDVINTTGSHSVGITTYNVTVGETVNGTVELSPSDSAVLPGTTVSITAIPDDGYTLDSIMVAGAEYDPDPQSFTVLDSDVTVYPYFKPYQADWGTDENNLTESGSLQEALNAAADDESITYIRVADSKDFGVFHIEANGGKFTFDLNGKEIRSESYTLYLNNSTEITITDTVGGGSFVSTSAGGSAILVDETAVKLTIEGGRFEGGNNAIRINKPSSTETSLAEITILDGTFASNHTHSPTINVDCSLVTVMGGNFESNVHFALTSGTLDVSLYDDPAGLVIANHTGEDVSVPTENIKLPDGYGLYRDGVLVNPLVHSFSYTVELITYNFDYIHNEFGTVIASHSDGKYTPGTVVTFEITPNDGYVTSHIAVTGASYDYETNSITILDSDVSVTVLFELHQASWGEDKDNLTGKGSLERALAEVSDGGYVQLVSDVEKDTYYSIPENKSLTLDLAGHTVTVSSHIFLINDGVNLTVTDTVGGGKLAANSYSFNMKGSSLTLTSSFEAQSEISDILWEKGSIDVSSYEGIVGLSVTNNTDTYVMLPADSITLPENYSFYSFGEKVNHLNIGSKYEIDLTKYYLNFTIDDGLNIDTSSSRVMALPGETVYFGVEVQELYELTSITSSSTEIEITLDPDTGRYYFVMPEQDIDIQLSSKHLIFTWGTDENTLSTSGDLTDLVEAINSDEALYVRMNDHFFEYVSEGSIAISGKAIIDLNGFDFDPEFYSEILFTLAEGADITLFSNVKVDDLYPLSSVHGNYSLQKGSKLTIDGIGASSVNIFCEGGVLDVSKAHLTSDLTLINNTDEDITLSDTLILGKSFRVTGEPVQYNPDGTYEKLSTLKNSNSAKVLAAFTVSFDFGEGEGELEPIEVLWSTFFTIPDARNTSHPDGLSVTGWTFSTDSADYIISSNATLSEPGDTVFTARWGNTVQVGGVSMIDGDYLPSGSNEVTRSRPVSGGYAYYKDGILTLNNFTLVGHGSVIESRTDKEDGNVDYSSYAHIFSTRDLVIELIGYNNVGLIEYDELEDHVIGYNIFSAKSITIRGEGTLNATASYTNICAANITLDSCELVLYSTYSQAISCSNLTAGDSRITSLSGGIYADNIEITDSELNLFVIDAIISLPFGIITTTLNVNGGIINIEAEHGICAQYITVNGGVIDIISSNCGITNSFIELPKNDSFFNISGGTIDIISSNYGIYFNGAVTVSGGEIYSVAQIGIYVSDGSLTVSGGELTVLESEIGIIAQDANVTVSGGSVYVNGSLSAISFASSDTDSALSFLGGYSELYASTSAISSGNNVIVNGGTLIVYAQDVAIIANSITLDGRNTVFATNLEISSEFEINTEDITHIYTDEGLTVYLGADLPHTWSEDYYFDSSSHWRICTSDDCVLHVFEGYDVHSVYEEFGYSEHTIPVEGSACICGYATTEEIVPEDDTVLIIGNYKLKNGNYLDQIGNISDTKPEGGYLYVLMYEGQGYITLNDFTFNYSGDSLMQLLSDTVWSIEVYGDSVLTLEINERNVEGIAGGEGIVLIGGSLAITGPGSLTINANEGISGNCASLSVDAELTINAKEAGIIINGDPDFGSRIEVYSTLVINSESSDGIHASNTTVTFNNNASVTVCAGDDGIYLTNGTIQINGTQNFSITAEDDGMSLTEANIMLNGANVSIISLDDEGIDASDSDISFENSEITINADDLGIDLEYCSFTANYSEIEIISGDDGFDTFDSDVYIGLCTLNITAADKGLDIGGSLNDMPIMIFESEVNINSSSNELTDARFDLEGCALTIKASDNGIELSKVSLCLHSSELTVDASNNGIIGVGEYSELVISSGRLYVDATRIGIAENLLFDMYGELDVSVLAFVAIACERVGFGEDAYYYDELPYLINAVYSGSTFLNEYGTPASYVTVISYDVALDKIADSSTVLDQLVSEGGEFDLIAGSIEDLNGIIDTLTNLEGEGRLDLIEKANEAINNALITLGANLEKTNKELDEAVNDSDKKLDEAKAELEAAIKALEAANGDTAAQLSAALEALEAANKNNDTLKGEVEAMETELTEADQKAKSARTATTVIASVALTCNVAMIAAAIFLEIKKKSISNLFSGLFRK